MKFVFTIDGWYLSGFVTFCRNLSAGLRSQGHEVALLVLPNLGKNHQVPQGLFDQCVVVPRGVSRISPFVAKVARAIERLQPDVLVLTDSPDAMAALPYIRRSIIRTPVIHNVAQREVEIALNNPIWWDRVIAVSDFVAESLRANGVYERISVCPYGVPLPSATHTDRKRRPGPLRIVSASRIVVRQKRMERLPALAKILTELKVDYHWRVLGDGPYLPKLRQELNRFGLNDRFEFKGSVSPSVVASTFLDSDVFIMVSDFEGLPQALLEAMAHGVVPVVSRISGSTTCAVEHGMSGYLCDPSEPGQFAKAVAELAGNPSLCRNMGLRAAETVARNFSLDAFTERFLTIVNELRSLENTRAQPLTLQQSSSMETPFRCCGFWRTLRSQTLGRMKRWLQRKASGTTTPDNAELPVH